MCFSLDVNGQLVRHLHCVHCYFSFLSEIFPAWLFKPVVLICKLRLDPKFTRKIYTPDTSSYPLTGRTSCHRLNKMLKAILKDLGPYLHESIAQLYRFADCTSMRFYHIP